MVTILKTAWSLILIVFLFYWVILLSDFTSLLISCCEKNILSPRGQWSTETGCPEIASPPCSEASKIQLDNTLSNLVWCQNRSCSEQKVGLETSWGSFQPELSDLWGEILILKSWPVFVQQQIFTTSQLLQPSWRPCWSACLLLLGTPRDALGARVVCATRCTWEAAELFSLAIISFLWKNSVSYKFWQCLHIVVMNISKVLWGSIAYLLKQITVTLMKNTLPE